MFSKQFKIHTGKDGVLNLQIPVGLPDQDIEVLVLVESEGALKKNLNGMNLNEIMGKWGGQALLREDQGEYNQRENLE